MAQSFSDFVIAFFFFWDGIVLPLPGFQFNRTKVTIIENSNIVGSEFDKPAIIIINSFFIFCRFTSSQSSRTFARWHDIYKKFHSSCPIKKVSLGKRVLSQYEVIF
jgi:hypothetical protein